MICSISFHLKSVLISFYRGSIFASLFRQHLGNKQSLKTHPLVEKTWLKCVQLPKVKCFPMPILWSLLIKSSGRFVSMPVGIIFLERPREKKQTNKQTNKKNLELWRTEVVPSLIKLPAKQFWGAEGRIGCACVVCRFDKDLFGRPRSLIKLTLGCLCLCRP